MKIIRRISDGFEFCSLDTTNEIIVRKRDFEDLYDAIEIGPSGQELVRVSGSPQELEVVGE